MKHSSIILHVTDSSTHDLVAEYAYRLRATDPKLAEELRADIEEVGHDVAADPRPSREAALEEALDTAWREWNAKLVELVDATGVDWNGKTHEEVVALVRAKCAPPAAPAPVAEPLIAPNDPAVGA